MKKIIILFTVLLLTGCGVGTTRNSKNNSQHHNIYMNTDSKCAGIKRVSKKYKETNPKDMLEKVDFTKKCTRHVPKVVMTTVETTITKEEEAQCRKICEEIGAVYRIRPWED